ncbi:DUF533 domain-containing protein [Microbulbifer litoralis]|uniref:DUF533 domain-containing protein n=1 Tax=Microbulbifer litoralis TaxID=2933965 RepID=UPI0020287E3F|nr:DUF533 domain-containing protein [Microbulbifer sp. GX H0434]
MNKKLLLGALIGAGVSMLNKKMRQQPQAPSGAPGGRPVPPPDFSRVPPPDTGRAGPDDTSLDDILTRGGRSASGAAPGGGGLGDISGGTAPAGAGGAGMLIEIARRVFAQMQQQGGASGRPGGGSAGADNLNDVLGEIFGRMGGKFSPQGPGGPGGNSGGWSDPQQRMFGFADSGSGGRGEEQADLLLRAMIAAAQADSRINANEQRNISRALEGKLDSAELEEFRQLLTQPVDMEQVVSRVNDPATALNIYLVSALTVDEWNPKEKAYMDALAEKLGISEQAVHTIEQQLPRAA